jgi:hypothetical protein
MARSRRTHPVTIAFLGHVPNMRPLAHQASRCESEYHFKGGVTECWPAAAVARRRLRPDLDHPTSAWQIVPDIRLGDIDPTEPGHVDDVG